MLKWLRIVEEFDEDDKLLFKWEIEGADEFDVAVFVVVVVEFDDDNGILDGIGFFNDIEVNDDGLTSESIKNTYRSILVKNISSIDNYLIKKTLLFDLIFT